MILTKFQIGSVPVALGNSGSFSVCLEPIFSDGDMRVTDDYDGYYYFLVTDVNTEAAPDAAGYLEAGDIVRFRSFNNETSHSSEPIPIEYNRSGTWEMYDPSVVAFYGSIFRFSGGFGMGESPTIETLLEYKTQYLFTKWLREHNVENLLSATNVKLDSGIALVQGIRGAVVDVKNQPTDACIIRVYVGDQTNKRNAAAREITRLLGEGYRPYQTFGISEDLARVLFVKYPEPNDANPVEP